jgi:hypothetical protein
VSRLLGGMNACETFHSVRKTTERMNSLIFQIGQRRRIPSIYRGRLLALHSYRQQQPQYFAQHDFNIWVFCFSGLKDFGFRFEAFRVETSLLHVVYH